MRARILAALGALAACRSAPAETGETAELSLRVAGFVKSAGIT